MGIPIDLTRFVGGRARLWDFSPSHDRLVVKLVAPDETEAFLVLSGCDDLSIPVFWPVTKPKVVAVEDPFVEFVDDRVRIRCEELGLQSTYTRSP